MAIFGLGGRPHLVEIVPSVSADWGNERLSGGATLGTGAGAPSNPATDDFYIDLANNFTFYVNDGGTWVQTPYTFNLSAPTANDLDFADYWWHIDGSNNLLGIYGPKATVNYPADGDVITWDAASGSWIATSPAP